MSKFSRIKPVFIVTDEPERFGALVEREGDLFRKIGLGVKPGPEFKYVVENCDPRASLRNACLELRRSGVPSCRVGEMSVRNTLMRTGDNGVRIPSFPGIPRSFLDDTFVLCVLWGSDAPQIEASRRGILELTRLDPCPRVALLEILKEGQASSFEDILAGGRHLHFRVPVGEESELIFLKEWGYNWLERHIPGRPTDTIIAHDPDGVPVDRGWAAECRRKVRLEPGTAWHAFRTYSDSENPAVVNIPGYGYAKTFTGEIGRAPGLSWALSRGRWREMGGMNEKYLVGGGDAAFVLEVDENHKYETMLIEWWPWFRNALREGVRKSRVGYVDAEMVHVHHRSLRLARYWERNIAVHLCTEDVDEVVDYGDPDEVPRWRPAGELLREVLRRKPEMENQTAVEAIVNEERAKKERAGVRFSGTRVITKTDYALRRDICVEPWLLLNVQGGGINPCCNLGQVITYPYLSGGPYAGEDVWNSDELVGFRQRILDEGVGSVCPADRFCLMSKPLTVDEQLEHYRKRYADVPVLDRVREEILSGKSRLSTRPVSVGLYIGHRCNARCVFCWQNSVSRETHGDRDCLGEDHLRALKPLFRDAAYSHVVGGDLFANTDETIGKILSLPNPGVPVETTTNARGLSLGRWRRFVEKGPLVGLRVSLDSLDPDHYRAHRRRELAPVRDTLERICGEHPDSHRVTIVTSVITTLTLEDAPDLMRWAGANHVTHAGFIPYAGDWLAKYGHAEMDPWGGGWDPSLLQRAREVYSEVKEIGRNLGVTPVGYERVVNRLRDIHKEKGLLR